MKNEDKLSVQASCSVLLAPPADEKISKFELQFSDCQFNILKTWDLCVLK